MFPWQDNAEDSQHNPIEGVQFRVLDADGDVVTLLAADGSSLGESVSSESTGIFRFNLASAGSYVLQRRIASSYPYSYAYTFTVGGSNDASGVSFLASGTGAVSRTVAKKLASTALSAFDFMTDAEIADVRAGTNSVNVASKVQAAITEAATFGGEVEFPEGLYRLTSALVVPRNVTLRGLGKPYPVGGYKPTARVSGAVLYKAHTGHCISATGTGAYSECGGIYNLSIISDYDTYPAGDGVRIDKVGNYVIEEVNVWSCGGNGFTLGVTAGDVTGQVFVKNLYVNNCTGNAYHVRSKWLRAYNILSDGCAWAYYGDEAPEAFVSGFHSEGFLVGAIKLANNCGNSTFEKGFIGVTGGAAKAIEADNVAGNRGHSFDAVKIVGSGTVTGATIGAACFDTRFVKCDFISCTIGIVSNGDSLFVGAGTVFDSCGLPIENHGDRAKIQGITTRSTSGSWSIDHQAGGLGIWSGNSLDKPMKPTLFGGSNGNFGTNIVKDNRGYKTGLKQVTGAIPTGTNTAHGLSITPYWVLVKCLGAVDPPNLAWTFDATNVTITFTGGGSAQFLIEAYGVCENPA